MLEGVGGTVPADGAMCRAHSPEPGAGCWGGGGGKGLCPPQTGSAWGVHVYPPANVKPGQWVSRSPQVWAGVSAGRRVGGGFGGDPEA